MQERLHERVVRSPHIGTGRRRIRPSIALFGYVVLVLVTVSVCLAFDVYGVIRWVRGERFVMGTEEACWTGASRRVELDSTKWPGAHESS